MIAINNEITVEASFSSSNPFDNWYLRSSGFYDRITSITYGNDTSVAVGYSGQVLTSLTSSDGTSWTERTSGISELLNGIAYGNGNFVAVGDSVTILQSDPLGTLVGVAKGDIDNDNSVTLQDAILVLQFLSGSNPPGIRSDYATSGADVNGDETVGLSEVIYILQKVGGIR